MLGLLGLARRPKARIKDGDFNATSPYWSLGPGWAPGAGIATHPAGSSGFLTQYYGAFAMVPGRTIKTHTVVSRRTAGTVSFKLIGGTTVTGTGRTAAGTYDETLTILPGNNQIGVLAGSTFDGDISEIKDVTGT